MGGAGKCRFELLGRRGPRQRAGVTASWVLAVELGGCKAPCQRLFRLGLRPGSSDRVGGVPSETRGGRLDVRW